MEKELIKQPLTIKKNENISWLIQVVRQYKVI